MGESVEIKKAISTSGRSERSSHYTIVKTVLLCGTIMERIQSD